MQIRERTLDDLGPVNAVCDASERTRWTSEMIGGMVVAPEFRRRGVGSALTRARLEWIWSRASIAHYFANEDNTASIRMFEALGFRPVARSSEIRGVTAGACDPAPYASAAAVVPAKRQYQPAGPCICTCAPSAPAFNRWAES